MINIKTSSVLITGAAGFIGSCLANRLIDSGMSQQNLMLVDNLEYGHLHNLNPGAIQCLTKTDVLGLKLGSFKPDIIFHFAGISSLPECESNSAKAYQYNTTAAAYILDLARANGSSVVFASTSAVYEKDTRSVYTEDVECHPRLIYPQTKLAAEQVCHSYIDNYGLDVCICRFANVFGAHQDFTRPNPPFTSYLVKQILTDEQITIYNDSTTTLRDYIYIDDLLTLIVKASESRLSGVYNISSSKCYSTINIINSLEKIFNKNIAYVKGDPMKFWDKYPQLMSGVKYLNPKTIKEEIFKNSHCSNSKILNALNLNEYKFVSMEDGLLKIVEFQKQFSHE